MAKLAMHVGKRRRINLDGTPELVRPAIGDPTDSSVKGPIFGERVNPSDNVFFLGDLIRLPNCRFICGHWRILLFSNAYQTNLYRKPPATRNRLKQMGKRQIRLLV